MLDDDDRTPAAPPETLRVLLAEDDIFQSKILQRLLERAGYTVETAADGEIALAAFVAGQFDILITDWDMERMDGATLCRRVRAAATLGRYVYIIILTAHSSVADVVSGFDAGADDYLRKPAAEAELLARLNAGRRILKLEQQVYQLSLTDPLLAIPNRRYLDQQLPREIDRAQRYDRPLTVILADLDHFKRINDEHGHPAGDQVLQCFARRMRENLRLSDWIARIGGEEFAIVLPDTALESALQVAGKLREACGGAPMKIESGDVSVTASFGVGQLGRAGGICESQQGLFKRIDAALYQAKRGGRNRIESAGVGQRQRETAGE